MVFAFSLCGAATLVKYDTEQIVGLRVARVRRDNLSSCRFRLIKPAGPNEVGSFRKFGGQIVGRLSGFARMAEIASWAARRLRANLRRCDQYRKGRPSKKR
jgi:hypothetical protein